MSLYLSGRGEIIIKVLAFTETAAAKCIIESKIFLSEEGTYIDLPAPKEIDGQIIAIQIEALTEIFLSKLQWVTEDLPKREVNLAAVITKFKREKEVLTAIRKFSDAIIRYSVLENIELYVIDNGSSVLIEDLPTEIHLITNPNLGGAGGFARG